MVRARRMMCEFEPCRSQKPGFKWRRVNGRAHYLPSSEQCVADPRGFLGYQEKINFHFHTLNKQEISPSLSVLDCGIILSSTIR